MVTKEDVEKAFAEYEAADIKFLAKAAENRPVGWVDAMVAFTKYWKLKEEYENESN